MVKSNNKKVLVAMSGGIDSSAAVILLRNQGYHVTGCIMQLTDSTSSIEKSKRVAEFLGIEIMVWDLRVEFQNHVKDYFIREYLNARTPNPCIVCNEKMKFGLFLDKALDMNFDFIATGHYSSVLRDEQTGEFLLAKGSDIKKDQSYFLYRLNQKMLSKIIFPLSKFTSKAQTRKLVSDHQLPNASSGESQEICFIPNYGYVEYIKQVLDDSEEFKCMNKPGDIIEINSHKKIGSHIGLIHYTIGQSKGLHDLGKKYYVVRIDQQNNCIYVGDKQQVCRKMVVASNINIIVPKRFKNLVSNSSNSVELTAKVRYNSKEARCNVEYEDNSKLKIVFEEPQFAVTAGQSIVLYDKNIVVGGGVIF